MKTFFASVLILLTMASLAGCGSGKDKKPEDPNKAPMYRPIHHSKDSARA